MDSLISENNHSLKTRLKVFFAIFGAIIIWVAFFSPFITGHLQYFLRLNDPGPNLLIRHIFIFGMPDFLFCLACIHILARHKILRKVSCAVTKDAAIQGTLAASAVIVFALAQWLYYGLRFQFVVNYWSIAGNLFSNF